MLPQWSSVAKPTPARISAMERGPRIDLEPNAFRPVYDKPLGDPKLMRFGIIASLVGIAVCGFGAWHIGEWWAMILPAFPGLALGIAWAGLAPGFWYREPPNT